MSTDSPELRRRPLSASSSSSESPVLSPPLPHSSVFHSLSHKQILRKAAQARRSGVSLPLSLLASPELGKGLRALDNFGFRRDTAHLDSAGLTMVAGKQRKTGGFHVSDLWSSRLQQDFLKRLRVERAQFAKERQASFLNYLVENRKTLGKPLEAELVDMNYLQLMEDKVKRSLITRKAAYRMSSKSQSEAISPNISPLKTDRSSKETPNPSRISRVESFIHHCNSTLRSFRQSSRLLGQSTAIVGAFRPREAGNLDSERPWLQVSPEKKARTLSVLKSL